MKNLILPIVMVLTFATAQAQRSIESKTKRQLAQNLEPEQMASIQAKKLTLALDLTEKQQAQVEQVLLNAAENRKEAMTARKEQQDLTQEDKIALLEKSMDQKIATKRAMTEILNVEQYDKLEKMQAKRERRLQMNRKEERRSRKM